MLRSMRACFSLCFFFYAFQFRASAYRLSFVPTITLRAKPSILHTCTRTPTSSPSRHALRDRRPSLSTGRCCGDIAAYGSLLQPCACLSFAISTSRCTRCAISITMLLVVRYFVYIAAQDSLLHSHCCQCFAVSIVGLFAPLVSGYLEPNSVDDRRSARRGQRRPHAGIRGSCAQDSVQASSTPCAGGGTCA